MNKKRKGKPVRHNYSNLPGITFYIINLLMGYINGKVLDKIRKEGGKLLKNIFKKRNNSN